MGCSGWCAGSASSLIIRQRWVGHPLEMKKLLRDHFSESPLLFPPISVTAQSARCDNSRGRPTGRTRLRWMPSTEDAGTAQVREEPASRRRSLPEPESAAAGSRPASHEACRCRGLCLRHESRPIPADNARRHPPSGVECHRPRSARYYGRRRCGPGPS